MLGKFPQGFLHMGVEFSSMTAQVVVFHLAAAGKQLLVPLRGQPGKQRGHQVLCRHAHDLFQLLPGGRCFHIGGILQGQFPGDGLSLTHI